MREMIPMDEYGVFADDTHTARANSLMVAKYFNKRHADVLRDVEKLDCSRRFSQRNFALAEYIDKQGKPRPYVAMTRDGFVFLVMGYRGKQAAEIKEAYINRFNAMEKNLSEWHTSRQLMKRPGAA